MLVNKHINIILFRIKQGGIYINKLADYLSFIVIAFSFLRLEKSIMVNDAPLPWQMNFQQSASPTMEGIVDLHHNIMIFMIYIVVFISYVLVRAIMLFNSNVKTPFDAISRTRHYLSLEIIWTILPLFILFWIALPSFALLYSVDHCPKIDLTVKVIGRQWYWTYEIDAFLKHRMKKPNYTDFKETGIIYELISQIIGGLYKNKDTLLYVNGNISFLTPSITSLNNLFFALINRLVTREDVISKNELNDFINVYLDCLGKGRRLAGVLQDSYLTDSRFGDSWVFRPYVLVHEYDPLDDEAWAKPSNYDETPSFQAILAKQLDETNKEESNFNIICPRTINENIGYTYSPERNYYSCLNWMLESLIENFDNVYSYKHISGFKLLESKNFYNLLSFIYYKGAERLNSSSVRPVYAQHLLEPFLYIYNSRLNDDSSAISWKYLFSFILPNQYGKDAHVIYWLYTNLDSKTFVNVLSEFYYYNREIKVLQKVKGLAEIVEISRFDEKHLIKDFFYSLTTGEFYDFYQKLESNNLTLVNFVKKFAKWYGEIYLTLIKNFDDGKIRNFLMFYPMLYSLSGGSSSWIKNSQSLLFSDCPTPFVKNLSSYTHWVNYVAFRYNLVGIPTENADIAHRKAVRIPYEFILKIIDKNFNVSFSDYAVAKTNRVISRIMSNEISVKTFIFLHTNFEKDILSQYSLKKNKFYHYLVEFDSCIVSDNEVYNNYLNIWNNKQVLNLKNLPTSFCGWWRLLEVDNRLVLPIKTRLRILVTSSDVLHSWAVPSLGVKIDACPGRLNCVYVYIKRPGVFHGQCSELCGVKHGFMPIVVHAVTRDKYNRWFADTCELVN